MLELKHAFKFRHIHNLKLNYGLNSNIKNYSE